MTHRVTYKWVPRDTDDGLKEYFAVGDEFEPTDEELSAYGDRLEQVTEEPQETEDQSSVDETQSLDEMDFRELQQLAGEYEDISGRQPEEDLREALREKEE